MVNEVDKAYAAGFFDGEGHVEIRKHTQGVTALNFQASASQNDRQPLDWLRTLFGGKIYRPHGNKRSNAYIWIVSGHSAYMFLDAILPYLMVKKEDAEEAIDRWVNR